MSTAKGMGGRLCNKVIMNLCCSIISEKNNLKIDYEYEDECNKLGLNLFHGDKEYENTIVLTESNYLGLLNDSLQSNIRINSFFQTKDISNFLVKYLRLKDVQTKIMNANPYSNRYDNNNDIFIHVRLGDTISFNPGLRYYETAIPKIKTNIYISSDSIHHEICQTLIKKYNAKVVQLNEVNTIQFGSTCKHVVLSHGSFSAVIGFLSFYSNIYYPEYDMKKLWYGDMFSIPEWSKIKYL
jgi:hypothetical protein